MTTGERERRVTELGVEVKCAKCKEFWPEDREFFFMSGGRTCCWCKACYRNDPKVVAKDARWRASQRKSEIAPPAPPIDWAPLRLALLPRIEHEEPA